MISQNVYKKEQALFQRVKQRLNQHNVSREENSFGAIRMDGNVRIVFSPWI
jgi:hypothetical protein